MEEHDIFDIDWEGLGISEEEEDSVKASFNKVDKVAVKKPFNEPKLSVQDEVRESLERRQDARNEMRCSKCGNIKQQRKEGQGKFRMVCTTCKAKKRTDTDRKKRNETRST